MNPYVLEKLMLELTGMEPVPAYFTPPEGLRGPAPVLLCHPAHGGKYHPVKAELILGRGSLRKPPYAEVAASLGFCAFCADTWAFGERATRTETDLF